MLQNVMNVLSTSFPSNLQQVADENIKKISDEMLISAMCYCLWVHTPNKTQIFSSTQTGDKMTETKLHKWKLVNLFSTSFPEIANNK